MSVAHQMKHSSSERSATCSAVRVPARSLMRRGAALLSALLVGCFSGLHSNEPVQQTYVLELQPQGAQSSADSSATSVPAGAAAVPVAGHEDALEVLLPVAAAGLSGDGIALLRPGERLDYYSGGRWAAPAPALLQRLVVETLRRRGRFGLVESDTGPFDAAYFLSLELTHFEADYAGSEAPTVRVELVGTLGRRTDRNRLQSITASSSVQADADRMQSVVSAFERATNEALSQLAQRLEPPPPTAPRSP
jgi:cholesterol transport system auxiliary component